MRRGVVILGSLVSVGALALATIIWIWSMDSGGSYDATRDTRPPGDHTASTAARPSAETAEREVHRRSPAPSERQTSGLLRVWATANGTPLGGVRVEVARPITSSWPIWDQALAGRAERLGEGETDSAGLFVCALPLGHHATLRASHESYPLQHVDGVQAGDEVHVTMDATGTLRGSVRLLGSGVVVPGVTIAGYGNSATDAEPLWKCTTDFAGNFHVQVSAGTYDVEVYAPAHATPRFRTVTVQANEELELLWEIEDCGSTFGRVVRGETGEPVAGALVARSYTRRCAVETGPDGSFELRGFPNSNERDIFVWAQGLATARFEVAPRQGSPSARLDIVLELSAAATVRGQVVDRDARGLPGAYVAVVDRVVPPRTVFEQGQWRQRTGEEFWHGRITDESGTFEIADLDPRAAYAVVCVKAGFGTPFVEIGRLAPLEVRTLAPIVLQAGSKIAGSIAGVAIAGRRWNVRLRCPTSGTPAVAVYPETGFPSTTERDLFLRSSRGFTFDNLGPGKYEVSLVLNGRPLVSRAVDIPEGEPVVRWVELQCEAPVQVRVDLVGGGVDTLKGAILSVSARGLGNVQHTRLVGRRFTLELPSGDYDFKVSGLDPRRARVAPVQRRIEGAFAEFEVAVAATAKVAGSVVDTFHRPVAGARVTAVSAGKPHVVLDNAVADGEGRFELWVEEGDVVDVLVRPKLSPETDALRAAAESVRSGALPGMTPRVRAGELDVRVFLPPR